MGREADAGGRRGGEKEEADARVGGGGGLRSKVEEVEVEEGEVYEMHQLPRSSLAAASVPSAKGSCFLSPQNSHHHHNDHHQPSVKDQNQRASSPRTNSRVSSRTVASFKQRTVGQNMPGGGTPRPPIQFSVSSGAQLARPVAVPAHSSSHLVNPDGQDAGLHFQGGGRPSGPLPPRSSVTNHSDYSRGLHMQSQPRTSVHRPMSRSASPGVMPHASEEPGLQGPSVAMVPALPTAISHTRNYSGTSHPQVSQASSPQLTKALHQQQAAISTVTSQQQQLSSASCLPVSGSDPASNNEVIPRDRGSENSILVKVCDRKVRLSSEQDPTALYALCRRWVRNDVLRTDQAQLWEQPPLPRPLTADEAEKTESEGTENGNKNEDSRLLLEPELARPVESMSGKELLQHHVEHFKNIRKRSREERMQRVARFRQRLAVLLPTNQP